MFANSVVSIHCVAPGLCRCKLSVQVAVFAGLTSVTGRQKPTDRFLVHLCILKWKKRHWKRYSVLTVSRIYVRSTAMRPNNE